MLGAARPCSTGPGCHAHGVAAVRGNSRSTNACAVGRGSWFASPGRSLASMNTYSSPSTDGTIRSMPVTGMPIASAASTATLTSLGLMSSVTSRMVPPVCRFAVRRTTRRSLVGSTSSRPYPPSATVSSVSSSTGMTDSPWVAAERLRLCASTSCRTVCLPLPTTSGGRRTAAAITLPLMTTRRRSSPAQRSSMITSGQCLAAHASARSRSSGSVTPTVMPAPCSPRAGLTTTEPTSLMNA